MGSHYIRVQNVNIDKDILDIVCPAAGYDETPPPPEIYCPVAGYIPDPTIYHEDPVITDAPKPGPNQIRLIVTDSGSRHVQFKCQVSNTGKYVVTVMGAGDTVIETKLQNNNTVCQVFVPLLEGYLADGYSYYYIDIAPELGGNDLTLFQATINTTYDSLGGYIIAAIFNTPGMLSLANAFQNNKRVQSVEFISDMDDLTTLLAFASGASELKKLVLPESLPEVTTMVSLLVSTGIIELIFPKFLPKVTTMQSMLFGVPLKSFVFPENLPLLESLAQCIQNSEIQNVSFAGSELPEVTTLLNFANGASKLKTIMYPEMPLLTTIENANYNCDNIEYITYQGESPLITTIKNTASNCPKLKKLVFPEVIENISSIANIQNVVDNCGNLEEIVLPKTLYVPDSTGVQYFFNRFLGCYKLEKISTVENTIFGNRYGRLSGNYLTSLKRFDQPNMCFHPSQLIFSPSAGLTGKLEYFDIDWEQQQYSGGYVSLDFQRQNISISEVRRILSKLDFIENTGFNGFKLNFNPEWDAIIGSWDASTILSSGRKVRFTIAKWDSRIKIGSSLFVNLGNGRDNQMIIRANDYFSLHNGLTPNSFSIAPYNGTRCIIKDTKWQSFDLFTKKVYYVINSDEDTGLDFQLSETLGGQPAQFSFTQNEIDVDSTEGRVLAFFDNYVTDINFTGTYYEVETSFPAYSRADGGRFVDSTYFDFWEFIIKGFSPY